MKYQQKAKERFPDFKKEGVVKAALDNMKPAYEELQSFRQEYKLLHNAYYNSFENNLQLDSDTKNPKILRSHFIATAAEIFSRGMNFPVFKIEAKARSDEDIKTKESIAFSLIEWGIRSSGYEDIYQESKYDWTAFGDCYRRPYARRIHRRNKRANKKTKSYNQKSTARMVMQYESLEQTSLLFDNSARYIHSNNTADSISWWARTQIYDEQSLVRRFGSWILDHAKPGAMIDVDRNADETSHSDRKNMRYYEVIEYQNVADEVEMVLVGYNAFPVVKMAEGEKCEPNKKFAKYVDWVGEYPHYNSFGEPILTIHNNYFYWNKNGIRNFGLAHRLFGAQIAHEIIENSKLQSTRKRLFEIPVITGGRKEQVDSKMREFQESSAANIYSYLHIPSSAQSTLPKASVIRFEGISSEEGERSTRDIHEFAKNSSGVSLSRLEVQSGIGVGQSEILEEEKTVAVEAIVKNNIANLKNEFVGILDYIINMNGFNLDDTITYTKYGKVEGQTRDLNFSIKKAEISIKEAAKKLEDFEFDLYIDRNSIIEKHQVALAGKIIDLLGTVDPAALPEVAKSLMKRLADVMRIDLTTEDLEGIEKSRAMGGKSQFQSSQESVNPNPVQNDAVNPETMAAIQGLQGVPEQNSFRRSI